MFQRGPEETKHLEIDPAFTKLETLKLKGRDAVNPFIHSQLQAVCHEVLWTSLIYLRIEVARD